MTDARSEVDRLREALRVLDDWCPSTAPNQAEIDLLLKGSLLDRRRRNDLTRLNVPPTRDDFETALEVLLWLHSDTDDGHARDDISRVRYLIGEIVDAE